MLGALPPQQVAMPQHEVSASEQLCVAAASGQTNLARSLIQHGADVNGTDKNGLTPVMLAVLGGHLDTAVQLALAGADLSRGDQQGHTALEHAVAASNREVRPRQHLFIGPTGCRGGVWAGCCICAGLS